MIRINLLNVEKPRAAAIRLPTLALAGQQLTIGCGIILVAGAAFIGWRYVAIQQDAAALDGHFSQAQAEMTQMRSVLDEVQQFEQRRTHLQQRVELIEALRKGQTGPVHMLDEISRALPPALWLTDLKQSASGAEVLIEGRCTGLSGLTDFVSNLERSGYFKKSIEIVNSQLEASRAGPDLIKFSIKAQFNGPIVAPLDPAKAAARQAN